MHQFIKSHNHTISVNIQYACTAKSSTTDHSYSILVFIRKIYCRYTIGITLTYMHTIYAYHIYHIYKIEIPYIPTSQEFGAKGHFCWEYTVFFIESEALKQCYPPYTNFILVFEISPSGRWWLKKVSCLAWLIKSGGSLELIGLNQSTISGLTGLK